MAIHTLADSTRSPVRLLMIEGNDDNTVGGSHRSMFELVSGIDRRRFDPIVCFHRENQYVDMLRAIDVRVLVLDTLRERELAIRSRGGAVRIALDSLRGIAWRFSLLRSEQVDLVHINNSPMLAADDWLPAARLSRIPIVSMERGRGEITHPRLRRLAGYFDHVIAVSDHVATALRASGVPARLVSTVYNGIDAASLAKSARAACDGVRASIGLHEDQRLAVMVGNIRRWKGQHVVLAALSAMAPRERDGVHVAFLGATASTDAPYETELRATVAREGLQRNVSFLGWQEDVGPFLAAADVAIHASITPEPFGRVIVEAMAMGTPIIAAQDGGPSEIVTSTSGRLFDTGDPSSLASALRDVLGNPALRATLSDGARERARAFGVPAMVSGVTAIYERVLGSGT
jgi:glycosyltransferase involved in cell wall biosynthesis